MHDRERLLPQGEPERQGVTAAPNGTLSGWDLETTLDVDMVSAACPLCKTMVVEANS
jgi:hypothetical protein